MVSREKMKGYGAYWFLVEALHRTPGGRLPLSELGTLARLSFVRADRLLRIIMEYGLFTVANEDFYSEELSQCMCTTADNERSNGRSNSRSNERPNERSNERSLPKKARNSQKTSSVNACVKSVSKVPKVCTPHVRTRASVADDNIIADNINNNSSRSAPVPTSWQVLVDALAQERTWLEHVWTSAGLSVMHMNQLHRVLKAFKDHIQTYSKGPDLTDLRSTKTYFANFVSPYSRPGQRLRTQLSQWSTALPPTPTAHSAPPPSAAAGNAFEVLVNSRRTYSGGIPIPDNAPPRPSATAFWDMYGCCWVV